MFLILGWGYQPERVRDGIYLLFYTLLASLPLLVGILFIYISLGSLCLFFLCGDNSLVGGLYYVCMVFALLVKTPMFMIHLWLPRAHVEAPVSGSIILAGVLLKLRLTQITLRNRIQHDQDEAMYFVQTSSHVYILPC